MCWLFYTCPSLPFIILPEPTAAQPPSIVLKFDASVRKRQKIHESTSLVWLPSMLHVNAVRAAMVPAGLLSTLTHTTPLVQTMTFIPAAQPKIQKSATSHDFSKQSILLTFSGSEKLLDRRISNDVATFSSRRKHSTKIMAQLL